MTVREEIAKNLRYYRKQSRITQKQLAEQIGVNNTAVSNWEKGLNSIDIDTLHKVCKVLNISINDMFGAFSNSQHPISEFDKKLLSAYHSHPEMQSAVNKMLDIQITENTKISDDAIEEMRSGSAIRTPTEAK